MTTWKFLEGRGITNTVVVDRDDFKLDSEGNSYFDGILQACEIPQDKWSTIQRISIKIDAYSDIEKVEA